MKHVDEKEVKNNASLFNEELLNEIEFRRDSEINELRYESLSSEGEFSGRSDYLIDIDDIIYVEEEILKATDIHIDDEEKILDIIIKDDEDSLYEGYEFIETEIIFPISLSIQINNLNRDNDRYKIRKRRNDIEYGILFYIDNRYFLLKAIIYKIKAY